MRSEYADAYADLHGRHWWWRAREAIVLRHIGDWTPASASPAILDVGCGAGLWFDRLSAFGEVWGIEPDPKLVARSGRWRDRIANTVLDERYVAPRAFDLVVMLDVLEHVRDPAGVLRRARELMAPNGTILITVPAFLWLWTSHDAINEHVTRFTARQLDDLVRAAGFVPAVEAYLFQALVMGKLLVRVLEAVRLSGEGIPSVPPPALNEGLRRYFEFEARWLSRAPGSSLLVRATRA